MKISNNTVTRNLNDLAQPTGNIYKSVAIIAKRANQLSVEEKKELKNKLEEFTNDKEAAIDAPTENKERIEISKFYERQPKSTLVAIAEFEEGDIVYRKSGR